MSKVLWKVNPDSIPDKKKVIGFITDTHIPAEVPVKTMSKVNIGGEIWGIANDSYTSGSVTNAAEHMNHTMIKIGPLSGQRLKDSL